MKSRCKIISQLLIVLGLASSTFAIAQTDSSTNTQEQVPTSKLRPDGGIHVRDNWYIEFALYPAGDMKITTSGGSESTGLNDHRTSRFGAQFGAGATVNSRLLFGGEISSFVVAEEKKFGGGKITGTVSVANLMPMLTFFPMHEGLFLRGGVGLTNAKFEIKASGFGVNATTDDSISGYGYLVGAGYAFWLGKGFNLSVKLDYNQQFYNDKIFSSDYKIKEIDVWMLGIGFHWY